MQSKELKSYNLPEDRVVISSIDAKPYLLFFIVIFVGLVFSGMRNYAHGVALTFFGLSGICFLPKRVLVEFYSDYMVVYNRPSFSDCVLIYYNEVMQWSYKKSMSYDELVITLVDGSVERVEGYSRSLFENNMNIYLKGKKAKSR